MAPTLDMDVVILGVQNLAFGRPGASSLEPWGHFGSLGTPWGTMGAAGRTRGGPEPDWVRAARECPSTLGGLCRIAQRRVVLLLLPVL